jgi:hypothetical protein
MTEIGSPYDPDASRLVDRRMALAREWDTLVEEVRGLEGFEDFLKPPPLEKLLPASDCGPVAVINVSQWRCDALLVVDRAIRVRELPLLTAADVTRRTRDYLAVLDLVSRRRAEYWHASKGDDGSPEAAARHGRAAQELMAAQDDAEDMLRLILRWLWRTVTEPVLDELGFRTTPTGALSSWPRLWWCPTGLLTLLPLHAAGDHLADGPDLPTVLDRVVSSYTPTLRVLAEARAPLADDECPRILVVTVPQVDDEAPLPEVETERAMLKRRFAGRYTLFDGPDATVAAVAEQLPRHRWVHFSCHGDQLLDDPSQGGLRLADGRLTIEEVSARQYQGEFAFLAACKTATGGVGLADEAITLAAALHYTGYRHVIGTLWTVSDTAAAAVAEAVYGPPDVPFEPALSPYRLHTVLSRLRDTERLSVWTPFTHIGP